MSNSHTDREKSELVKMLTSYSQCPWTSYFTSLRFHDLTYNVGTVPPLLNIKALAPNHDSTALASSEIRQLTVS